MAPDAAHEYAYILAAQQVESRKIGIIGLLEKELTLPTVTFNFQGRWFNKRLELSEGC